MHSPCGRQCPCENGKYVIFTTYEMGNVDLALCETELLEKLTEA
jgi:hypothetical protein